MRRSKKMGGGPSLLEIMQKVGFVPTASLDVLLHGNDASVKVQKEELPLNSLERKLSSNSFGNVNYGGNDQHRTDVNVKTRKEIKELPLQSMEQRLSCNSSANVNSDENELEVMKVKTQQEKKGLPLQPMGQLLTCNSSGNFDCNDQESTDVQVQKDGGKLSFESMDMDQRLNFSLSVIFDGGGNEKEVTDMKIQIDEKGILQRMDPRLNLSSPGNIYQDEKFQRMLTWDSTMEEQEYIGQRELEISDSREQPSDKTLKSIEVEKEEGEISENEKKKRKQKNSKVTANRKRNQQGEKKEVSENMESLNLNCNNPNAITDSKKRKTQQIEEGEVSENEENLYLNTTKFKDPHALSKAQKKKQRKKFGKIKSKFLKAGSDVLLTPKETFLTEDLGLDDVFGEETSLKLKNKQDLPQSHNLQESNQKQLTEGKIMAQNLQARPEESSQIMSSFFGMTHISHQTRLTPTTIHQEESSDDIALKLQQEQFAKRELSLRKKRKYPCHRWMKFECTLGSSCVYSHTGPGGDPRIKSLCRFATSGSCVQGTACPYSHDTKLFPCTFFHLKKRCDSGDTCRFSHEAMSEEQMMELKRVEVEIQSRKKVRGTHLMSNE